MSSHNIFQTLHESLSLEVPFTRDPGAAGTILVEGRSLAICRVTTAAPETRTLANASNLPLGTECLVVLFSDGGDLTIASDDTSVILTAEGDWALFRVSQTSTVADTVWKRTGSSDVYADIAALEARAYRTTTQKLSPYDFRVHDALGTLLSAGAGATDDLGVTVGVIGTAVTPTLNATVDDLDLTQEGVIVWQVPENYVAGGALTLSVDWTRTASADTLATLDAEVYRHAAAGTDLAAAAAPSTDINSAASGTITWAITGTNVVPGEYLDIRLIARIDDDAGATAAAVFEFEPEIIFTVADQS